MSKADAVIAIKTIMSLTRSCPKVKFFLTEKLTEQLLKNAPPSLLEDLKFRIRYLPRGFISILADIVHEDDKFKNLRRGNPERTRALLHEILVMKRKNPEYARTLLSLLKSIEMHPELAEKYRFRKLSAKYLTENYKELEEARKTAIPLLECLIRNFG